MKTSRVAFAVLALAASQHAAAQRNPEQLDVNAQLLAAARAGSEAAVRALLDRGADPDSRNRLGDTPLNLAARAGDVELSRTLLQRGASPDRANLAGVTPLMWAAGQGQLETVRMLLARGAALDGKDDRRRDDRAAANLTPSSPAPPSPSARCASRRTPPGTPGRGSGA
jgi:uncharacterized protein